MSVPPLSKTTDALVTSWIYKCPAPIIPYLQLIRADRPIGTWLLLLPCWWGLALSGALPGEEMLYCALLFTIGAFVMRGAGCVYNDIIDSEFDAQVARTAQRPIPAGLISKRTATIYLIGLCAAGLLVLLQFNFLTIATGCTSLLLVLAYPFMKRLTWWPQAWLGLTFNWGALMGWTASEGALGIPAFALYAAGFFWTLSYDTIYAHQDKEDDALIGVKSTALYLGDKTERWLWFFSAAQFGLLYAAMWLTGAGAILSLIIILPSIHQVWQIKSLDIDKPATCLNLFRANRDLGGLILIAILAVTYLSG